MSAKSSAERLSRFGVKSDQFPHKPLEASRGKDILLSQRYCSHIPPVIVQVESLEEYQKLMSSESGRAVMGPLGVRGCEVDEVSGEAAKELADARAASLRYVYEKTEISKPHRAEIERRYFPLKVALFANDQPIVIHTGSTMVIDDGVQVHDYAEIDICQGGALIVRSNSTINVGVLKKLPADGPNPVAYSDINVLGTDGTSGQPGPPVGKAHDGQGGADSSCNWAGDSCSSSSPGGGGGNGAPGNQGQNGNGGRNAPQLVSFTVSDLVGNFTLTARGGLGGNGGPGGAGGDGGDGGKGGSGTTCASTSCSGSKGGDGGNGGVGGPGGNGGNGADGGGVTFLYTPDKSGGTVMQIGANSGAAGGSGGQGGPGGAGGHGGGNGGAAGNPGAAGPYGANGNPGLPSTVTINQQP